MIRNTSEETKNMMSIIVISQFLLASYALCETIDFGQERANNFCSSINSDILKKLKDVDQTRNLTISYENHQDEPILPNLDTRKEIYTSKQFDYSYTFFYEGDKTQDRESISNLGIMGITAKLQSSVYTDLLIHHYDNFDELKQSGGPEANQELCLTQLNYLIGRAKQIDGTDIYRTKDVNYFRLIDSFGRRPSGLLMGNAVWLGVYDECLRLDLKDSNNEQIKTRYCMLNFKHRDWALEDNVSQLIAIKMAACLPKSCDSRNYKNKYELIEKLALIATGPHDINHNVRISSLYCLPDEQSTLRIWYYHPKVVITLTMFALWILTLLYSTYKYEKFVRNETRMRSALQLLEDRSGLKFTEDNKGDNKLINQEGKKALTLKIYKLLSIKINAENLFNTSNKSSLLDSNKSDEIHTNDVDNKQLVDLSCLEGIKVISMCYVILGHVLMTTTMIMSNGRDMASTTSMSWFLANLTPAFAVNSFFSITGILTSYLIFKTKQIEQVSKKPILWLGLIIYRYFRILPVYLIVIIYLKNLSKFVGSGPLWDYGTSSIGQRRICEEESIFWTILFGANFKSPFKHCIPSAWYLANDFQFFSITPIFITVLSINQRSGLKLLMYTTIIGYLAGIASIFMTHFDNLLPIANFMPHGLKTYITFFEHNYTQPQYRIPAYSIGLAAGYLLYDYERNRLSSRQMTDDYLSKRSECAKQKEDENNDQCVVKRPGCQGAPDWPENFKKHGILLSFLCVTVCCVTPYIAARLPFNRFFARLGVSLIMPSYHILFSLAVAIYVMLSSTGHGNRLMTRILSSHFWKPLARVSLCMVTTNIEVINYFIQTNKHTQFIDNKTLFVLNLSSIVVSYIVAMIVCILFEAPLRGVLNLALSYMMSKLTHSSSRFN